MLVCASEAQALAKAGVEDILIANQVVGVPKIQRLVALARRAHVSVAIDDLLQAEWISQAAAAAGVSIGLLVEVDIGMGRCGVKPGQAALELALTRLSPDDYFQVINFHSQTHKLFESPQPATPQNIQIAVSSVRNRLRALLSCCPIVPSRKRRSELA